MFTLCLLLIRRINIVGKLYVHGVDDYSRAFALGQSLYYLSVGWGRPEIETLGLLT